ncbi:ComF family protein [Hydrogenobacter thermophilus]|uniref:ComF family protein n=1 Tax=Hydrogenobacter thermophilus TaxID=940 RepID=UPI0030F5CC88
MIRFFAELIKSLGMCQEDCISCGGKISSWQQGFVCENCINSLKPHHPAEYKRLDHVKSYRVFGLYEGTLKDVILSIKFNANIPLAHWLGKVTAPYLWEYIDSTKPDIITTPAINLRRYWSRGFNHAEEILKGAEAPYISVFKRVGFQAPSAGLKKEERLKVVQTHLLKDEAIDLLENKRVLIFDDVLTTGATITRLAELSLMVGALEVHAFFVAKAL